MNTKYSTFNRISHDSSVQKYTFRFIRIITEVIIKFTYTFDYGEIQDYSLCPHLQCPPRAIA